mgnify:CR=1 FL=1
MQDLIFVRKPPRPTRVASSNTARSPKGSVFCGCRERETRNASNAGRAVAGMLWRSITSIRRLVKKVPHVEGTLFTLLALLLGFFVFYLGQKLDPIDALYLTIVTISTVGYGDISPSDACIDDEGNDVSGSTACVGMRVFSVFYILLGCGYVFAHLSSVFRGALEKFSNLVKRQIDKCSSTTEAVDTTGDGKCDTKVTGRSVGLSGRSHDITGDGVADFVEPPMAVVYWAQELLPAILLVTFVQLLSALIFTVCIPELDVCHTGLEPQPAQGPRQVCCSRV